MRPVRIADHDGGGPYDLTGKLVSWRVQAGVRAALVPAAGAGGAYDAQGRARAPEAEAELEMELAIIAQSEEGLYTELMAAAQAIMGPRWARGLRRLYWQKGAESGYWSYARALARPEAEHGPSNLLFSKLQARLALPDPYAYLPLTTSWLTANGYTAATLGAAEVPEEIAPDLTFAQFSVTTTPFAFTIKHTGDVESRRILFLFYSQAAGGMTNPRVRNATTGQEWQVTLTGATAQTRLSVFCAPALGRAQRSDNAGASWSDVTPSLSLGNLQGVVMELAPGANQLTYVDGGTPNLVLYVAWWHAFRMV